MNAAREWQLQEAKGKLSQLVRDAVEAPQTITLHGKPTAVVIRYEEYRRLVDPPRSLIDVLRAAPEGFDGLFAERDKDATLREVSL
jgi:prevent-host-death family protein